jgi:hypothetical protein
MTPTGPRIGDQIDVVIPVILPWHRYIDDRGRRSVRLDPPDGLQLLDSPAPKLAKVGAGTATWHLTLQLQAYELGPFTGMTAEVPVSARRDGSDSMIAVAIPDVTINARLDPESDSGTLAELGEMSPEFLTAEEGMLMWWIAAGVAVFGMIAVALLNRGAKDSPRYRPPPPKPWVVAEVTLAALEERLPMDADSFFVELTDIVRRYVERAFQLPALEQTTHEFLHELNRSGDRLSDSQRESLAEFLTAADMVKFARTDVSESQMRDALDKARRFIVETSEALIEAEEAGPHHE